MMDDYDNPFDGLDLGILDQEDPFSPRVDPDHIYSCSKRHNVFVYGTMKRGFINHHRINARPTCVYKGSWHTEDAIFKMYARKSSMGVLCPAVIRPELEDGMSFETYHISGELYEVDGWTLNEIDIAEGHPKHYERVAVRVLSGYGVLKKVWMYLFVGDEQELIWHHPSIVYRRGFPSVYFGGDDRG